MKKICPIVYYNLQFNRVFSQRVRIPKKDPGIAKRLKAIDYEKEEVEEDALDNYETDFMHLDKSYKEHQQQMRYMKEKERNLLVKQKYFKEKFPNFLTWHDKEQIKYLHNSDPEEWCVDKLSESFPALPEIIHKIVKNSWTASSQSRIDKHDQTVEQNWKLFEQSKLELPPKLTEHLKKFTNRSRSHSSFVNPFQNEQIVPPKPPPAPNSFSEIIASYQRLKEPPPKEEVKVHKQIQPNNNEETYFLKPSKNSHKKDNVTLQQLTQQLQVKSNLSSDEEILVTTVQSSQNYSKSSEVVVEEHVSESSVQLSTKKSNEVVMLVKKTSDFSHLQYPERITIPKKICKKENVYKLNDCYYDYDGQFLYRVPGMD